jgi:hypothetical protein
MTTPWWRDPEHHTRLRAQYGSSAAAARALQNEPGMKVAPRNAQAWWAKMVDAGLVASSEPAPNAPGAQAGPTDPDGDDLREQSNIGSHQATLISAANPRGTDKRTPEDLIREKGMDPAEWDYEWEATEWDGLAGDGKVTTLARVKIRCVRKPESIFKFELPTDWRPASAAPPVRDPGQPILCPIFSDPHAPNYQEELVEASVAWLEDFKPERLFCLGDAGNNSPFGRHRPNVRPDLLVDPETAVWSTTELLARWANAAPGAERMLLWGNHDYWLWQRILEWFPKMATFRRWKEESPYLAMSNILRLDDVGWNYVDTAGEYHDNVIEIAPGLMGMHGTRTGKHGGALKEIEKWEGVSIVQGHDHTLGLTAVRYRRPRGEHVQRLGISAGSLANADLGYDPGHNVGQGWPVLSIWPDGQWGVDFALYDPVERTTTWRDWRYDAA